MKLWHWGLAAGLLVGLPWLASIEAAKPSPTPPAVPAAAEPDIRPPAFVPVAWSEVRISVSKLDDTKTPYIVAEGYGLNMSISCYGGDFYVRINPDGYLQHKQNGAVFLRVGTSPAWVARSAYHGDFVTPFGGGKFLAALLHGETEGQQALIQMANSRNNDLDYYFNMTGAKEAVGKLQQQCPGSKIPPISSFANKDERQVYPWR